ncbi:MAG: hypothetical protein CMJ25_30820 [Phycisphaerae bacterium]|nr:hypothetical protein [Phycisphaerae bacterium]
MASELDKQAQDYVDLGFTDRGDGTVVKGSLGYDSSTGKMFNTHSTDPQLNNNSSAASSASSSAGVSGGPSSEYLKQEGPLIIGKLTLDQLREREGDASVTAINNSDRHTVHSDGTISFIDTDGNEKWMPQPSDVATVDLSKVDPDVLQKAADISYLAQNTGVNSSDMDDVYRSLGIDPNDSLNFTKKDAILKAAGYTPGDSVNFYGNNSAVDPGAQILVEVNARRPSDQDLIDAGMDPNEISVVNSNMANSYYLEQKLAERGLDASSTYGRIGSTTPFASGKNRNIEDLRLEQDAIIQKYQPEFSNSKMLDILEWDLIKKKEEEPKANVSSGSGNTATVTGTTFSAPSPGQVSGGNTGSMSPPAYTSTPYINSVTPVYGAGQTGTSETTIPTYEAGLGRQATQFADRATCQASFYQPQTQAEKEAAGDAPAFENVLYRNRFGMSTYIQHINGVPSMPIPPGYFKVEQFTTQNQVQGQNQGGVIQGFNPGGTVNPAMNYKPGGQVTAQADGTFVLTYPDGTTSQAYSTTEQAQQADNLGKTSLGIQTFEDYSQSQGYNPDLPGYDQASVQNLYNTYVTDTYSTQQAEQAAADAPPPEAAVNQDFISGQQTVTEDELAQYQNNLAAQAYVAPGGAVAAAPTSYIDPNAYGSVVESTAGQAQATAPMVQEDQVAQISAATTADTPQKIGASQVDPNLAFSDVQNATADMTAAQMTGGPTQTITAAQDTASSVSGLTAATGQSVDVTGAPTRTLDTTAGSSELITGTGVDQSKVLSAFGEGEIKAASVQDELTGLMQQFEGGNTPAWAAGSMRSAMATLAARGLGASSMAGQAVIQAAMEASLPIAQIDAGNKQQMALFKGEQRAKFLQMDFDQAFQAKVMNAAKVSEIANMNFTAEQQIALENSRAANTMELQNLSNSQSLVMAEAAALAQMDTQNLNNRQQAEVQNAQNFLQIDMANLSNEQQTALFKQQSLVNSLLTDQAAANAAAQFNASSENQTNQFFANLSSSIGQFNAAQMNAMKQFNAGEVNSLLEFNANIQNQREMFNAQNYLVVAQANAQWRQNLSTLNTAAANETSMDYAKTVNGLTMAALDQIWQRERDMMDYAFTGGENQADRALSLLLGEMDLESVRARIDAEEDTALGALLTKIFFKV